MTETNMVYVVMLVNYDHGVDTLIGVFATREAAQEYVDLWGSRVNVLYVEEEMLRTTSGL